MKKSLQFPLSHGGSSFIPGPSPLFSISVFISVHQWLKSPVPGRSTTLHRLRHSLRPVVLGLWVAGAFMAGGSHARAQGQPIPTIIDPVAITRELKDGDPQSDAWALALRAYADPDGRRTVLDALKARDGFPKAALVSRLRHPELAIRLAALEILEGAAGKDFGFDPWVATPDDPANTLAMAAWQTWAKGDESATVAAATLDDESMGTYMRDIMAGQRDRAERALRMLEPHGNEATGRIQRFLLDTPNLSEAARAHLRAAQYRIVLRPAAGTEAAAVAQRLAFGTRDQQISALGQLRQFGLASMPIAMNFLEADDPLVRESALDTLLVMGGGGIFQTIRPMLEKESEPNVIHAAIRRFADIKSPGTDALLEKWLAMDDENLVVECLETIAKRSGSGSPFGMNGDDEPSGGGGLLGGLFGRGRPNKPKATLTTLQQGVVARFGDPAWRIRAAAFNAVAKLRVGGIDDAILKGMDDTDDFVQLAAMEAAAALSIKAAVPKMETLFVVHPERMAIIASGMASMQLPLTEKMHEAMAKAPADHVVGVVAALRTKGSVRGNSFVKLSTHANPDVRAAALGALANGFGENDDVIHRRALVNKVSIAKVVNVLDKRFNGFARFADAQPNTLRLLPRHFVPCERFAKNLYQRTVT